MPEAKVTKADLEHGLRENHNLLTIADTLGVSHGSVTRACRRHGIRLTHHRDLSPLDKLRIANEELTPLQALENAYFVISELTGQEDQSCLWPGLHLTPQRRALAQILYKNEGKMVSNQRILTALYLHDHDKADLNTIKVQISHLRKKIQGTGFDIETVWGQGYRFNRLHGTVFPWERKDTQ